MTLSRRMWLHAAGAAPAVAVVAAALATTAYITAGGWMHPGLAAVGIPVAAVYAASVARRAGATLGVALAWALTAAVCSIIALIVTWLIAFVVALELTCGSEGDCLG